MITIFDLETTGISPWNDRIVSLYCHDGTRYFHSLINPQMSIPEEATAVHGISDENVKFAPTFATIAERIRPFFWERVLCGYNSRRYDTIMLHAEYERVGLVPPFDLESVQEIDVFQVWRSVETQNLSSAVRRWLNREHEGAHGAMADANATWEVLGAIRKRYDLTTEECIKRTMQASRSPSFVKVKDEWHFAFGMNRGKPCREYPDYLAWMLKNGFDPETKRIARMILDGLSASTSDP